VLPSIDSFSFDGILKSIEPEGWRLHFRLHFFFSQVIIPNIFSLSLEHIVTNALNAVSRLCSEYQSSLQTEVDGLVEAQSHIDARMKEADKLTAQALKTTKVRTERLDSESSGLKGGDYLISAEFSHKVLMILWTFRGCCGRISRGGRSYPYYIDIYRDYFASYRRNASGTRALVAPNLGPQETLPEVARTSSGKGS